MQGNCKVSLYIPALAFAGVLINDATRKRILSKCLRFFGLPLKVENLQGRKTKTFRIYLDNGKTQEIGVSYFADLSLQKVYNIRVNSMNKDGAVLAVIPMGEKM